MFVIGKINGEPEKFNFSSYIRNLWNIKYQKPEKRYTYQFLYKTDCIMPNIMLLQERLSQNNSLPLIIFHTEGSDKSYKKATWLNLSQWGPMYVTMEFIFFFFQLLIMN